MGLTIFYIVLIALVLSLLTGLLQKVRHGLTFWKSFLKSFFAYLALTAMAFKLFFS